MVTNNSKDNHTAHCVEISASPISDLLMSIYILAFALGLVANLLTVGPIIRQICSHNVLGIYLLNLSISDLLYIFTMPLWIYYYRNDHRWDLGLKSCQMAGFFYYSNMYISIYLLCCISVDRCLAITFPLQAKTFRRSRYAWGVCLLVTLVVMSLHILVLVMDNLEDPLDDDIRCYESFPLTDSVALFNLIRVGLGFVAPLVLLVFCYTQIFSKVRRSHGVEEQVKRKVKLLSVAVIVIFAVCFAPYHILLLLRSLAYHSMERAANCHFEQSLHFCFSCTLALSSLNSVVDPLLYVLVSNGVKEDMCFPCRRGRRKEPNPSAPVTLQRQTYLPTLP
ncbi:G protein-coupled receptor 184 [Megalops cyprinoides]|uniref:G protein-coupled receptor 184 n=1 Tax=Megalops cyprinoides TaxID=118141 RepID=UPI001864AC86|nr:G protein-coupled receptor 184 [Megalops cyprinoides]